MSKGVSEFAINRLDLCFIEKGCNISGESKKDSQYAEIEEETENDISRSCAECDFSKLIL